MPSRCFLAVPLPRHALHLLTGAERAFLEAAPRWSGDKWVRADLRHITIKFIGPLPDVSVAGALVALGQELAGVPGFELALSGVRAVPSARRATMLWATLGPSEAAARLAAVCDAVLVRGFGVAADPRRFRPHVTLARARAPHRVPTGATDLATAALIGGKDADRNVSVRSVTLFSSTLGPGGPTYDSLGDIALGRSFSSD